ncbi:MAG: 4a-hydroxytetrahydrobiopterin dehydratase [Armatimonadota bacterium]
MGLEKEECIPCKIGQAPLEHVAAQALMSEVPGWTLKDHSLEREFTFKNFREAMGFVNSVADIAEQQGHHPDIYISYNKVKLELWTHKAGGLTRNDFILAVMINGLEK